MNNTKPNKPTKTKKEEEKKNHQKKKTTNEARTSPLAMAISSADCYLHDATILVYQDRTA